MRKIRIIEHISLDGVIQAPGGPDEDGDYALWRMDGAVSEPGRGRGRRRGAGQGLRSAAGPPHLRYLGRLLAEGREAVRWRTV